MQRIGMALAICCLLACVAATPGRAEAPVQFCAQVGTDDTLRPLPRALVPAARRAFGLRMMPPRQVERSSYFRCSGGRVLMCNVGANLPCGKADVRQTLSGADRWCVSHRGADAIPAYVTGHATIYRWRCDGARAVTAGAVLHVDPRGFVAEMWKPAD